MRRHVDVCLGFVVVVVLSLAGRVRGPSEHESGEIRIVMRGCQKSNLHYKVAPAWVSRARGDGSVPSTTRRWGLDCLWPGQSACLSTRQPLAHLKPRPRALQTRRGCRSTPRPSSRPPRFSNPPRAAGATASASSRMSAMCVPLSLNPGVVPRCARSARDERVDEAPLALAGACRAAEGAWAAVVSSY